MILLVDTNILLRLAYWLERLSAQATEILGNPDARLVFSAVSIWEVAIKRALNRPDFVSDPLELRRSALDTGFMEWAITSLHGAAVATLPPIHRDPFDRLLLAQASHEGVTLLTTDDVVARYPAPVRLV